MLLGRFEVPGEALLKAKVNDPIILLGPLELQLHLRLHDAREEVLARVFRLPSQCARAIGATPAGGAPVLAQCLGVRSDDSRGDAVQREERTYDVAPVLLELLDGKRSGLGVLRNAEVHEDTANRLSDVVPGAVAVLGEVVALPAVARVLRGYQSHIEERDEQTGDCGECR